jgi:hypothetical protein
MRTHFARLFLAAVAGVTLAGTCPAQPVPMEVGDERVPPGDFAIFPWDHLAGGKDVFEQARDCGFNIAGFVTTSSLDMVQAAGLKCFVTDPLIAVRGSEKFSDEEITSRVRTVVAAAGSHPAVFGYHLLDEPQASLFPLISKWVNAFHAAAPEAIAYVNLFPDYGRGKFVGGHFEDYLTSYVKMVRPKAYSYDHYALFEDGKIRDAYFPNLEAARKVWLEAGVPYWHVVLGNAHFHYAEPSYAGLRFQLYTSLAYDARGIGYFTYTARERGNYRLSAINAFGDRTPTFQMLRETNLQAHRLAPHLIRMKSVNVFHHPDVPQECRGIDASRHLTELTGDGPFLVGEFVDESGRPAFLIVNKSLTRSTNFKFKPRTEATMLKASSYTGEILPFSAENDWLAPGQGMLIILQPRTAEKP